jgi:hypothetical protein
MSDSRLAQGKTLLCMGQEHFNWKNDARLRFSGRSSAFSSYFDKILSTGISLPRITKKYLIRKLTNYVTKQTPRINLMAQHPRCCLLHFGILYDFLFYLEDRGVTFLRNVCFHWTTRPDMPWNRINSMERVLSEKPSVTRLLRNFTSYGTLALHWSISWARSAHTILLHPV